LVDVVISSMGSQPKKEPIVSKPLWEQVPIWKASCPIDPTPIDTSQKEPIAEATQGYESVLPGDEDWDAKLQERTQKEVAAAQKILEQERQSKNPKIRVKRVPPKSKFDMADVAAALDMPDLAKELSANHPKPIFSVTTNGPCKIFDRKTQDLCRIDRERKEQLKNPPLVVDEMNPCDVEELVQKLEKIGKREDKIINPEFNKIESLEWLVALCTKDKLKADRKLALAQRELDQEMAYLMDFPPPYLEAVAPPEEEYEKELEFKNQEPTGMSRLVLGAQRIQRLVESGEIDPSKDFPTLIEEGLEPEMVEYWQERWGDKKPLGNKQLEQDLREAFETQADRNLEEKLREAFQTDEAK
jgi:hypothetical protein